jgi:cytochrome bd-type quinol oxidase subunit 2
MFIYNPVIPDIIGDWTEFKKGGGLGSLISTLVNAFVLFSFIATLLYLLWGGIDWLISSGDEEKLKQARGRITNAIIGLFLIAAAYAIWVFLKAILGVEMTVPEPSKID